MMLQWAEACAYLRKRRNVLEKLAANTEAQCRFIKERKMKGLNRLLRERQTLIRELAGITEIPVMEKAWGNRPDLAAIQQELSVRQQVILERSQQVLQQAVAERASIAAELRQSKVSRQLANQYVSPWSRMSQGRRINEKG